MTYDIKNDIAKVLLSEEEIQNIVKRISKEIDEYYKDRDARLVLLCILKGSVVFMGDLMKNITVPVEIDFMKVSSYGASTTSSGSINIMLDIHRKDLSNIYILIIEDIIDSGRTLFYLADYLRFKGANSVRTCTLLDKSSRREVGFTADIVGAEIPNEFVVGYGLDYDEKYRALPFVGALKPHVYSTRK